MTKDTKLYSGVLFAGLMSFMMFASYSYADKDGAVKNGESTSADSSSNTTIAGHLPQVIKAPNLDKAFSFANEAVPMDNFDVRERLDFELLKNSYYHSSTIVAIKRARRYFPVIESILAENGVPDDFKYLAIAESNLSNAVSPAGAKGVWQFMPKTAQAYGLFVSKEIDERYHLEKATRAACKYLKEYKERFGTWTKAAAAYNMGGTRLSRDIRSQKANSYYDLNLNSETSRYVFRIIALKEIVSNPSAFGFQIDDHEKYPPMDDYINIVVDNTVESWADFAEKNGVSYRMLKVWNPWLINTKLTNNSRKEFLIKIPKNKF